MFYRLIESESRVVKISVGFFPLDEKRGRPIGTRRILNAAQAMSQPIPHALSLNYDDIFKIQRVRSNPFALGPVSYSMLASYLECPWCTVMKKRKRRSKEPAQFTDVQQGTLFSNGRPDPRMVGTLLHTMVNFLHTSNGPLTADQQRELLEDGDALMRFMRRDLLGALQGAGKISLAMFYNGISQRTGMLRTTLIDPIMSYQRNLLATDAVVFAAAERFQFKLLSTRKTFVGHPDYGGQMGLVGEFDQIRLRGVNNRDQPGGIPSIIEFKKNLVGKKQVEVVQGGLFSEEGEQEEIVQPTEAHAMQLMIYWLAFQTRWDLMGQMREMKGQLQEIPMLLQQDLELILYDLSDGEQYQLRPTSDKEALQALIECIFYLDWAMKSGYAAQAPGHECKRIPLTEVPAETIYVQIGYAALTAQESYQLAREAFERFKETIRWESYAAK